MAVHLTKIYTRVGDDGTTGIGDFSRVPKTSPRIEAYADVDECNAAGYHAIEFARVHVKVDDQGQPIPDSGFLAPVVLADKCVGCGLCQTRCNLINVKAKNLLKETAIWVEAGSGRRRR